MKTQMLVPAALLLSVILLVSNSARGADSKKDTGKRRALATPTAGRAARLKANAKKMKQYKRVHQYALDRITSGSAASL